jgi:hypothetical protein
MSKTTAGTPSSQGMNSPNIGEKLYSDCVALFSALSHHQASVLYQSDDAPFKEELGRFYLWGEGFRDGRLDVILATSPYLRVTILRFLVNVGDILTTSKSGASNRVIFPWVWAWLDIAPQNFLSLGVFLMTESYSH